LATRSYLYSLSNRPASYADRPETISGLSEWSYDVPFMTRLLMSGDPQLCTSLLYDGFDEDESEFPTSLHAISSRFDLGFERVKRFIDVVRSLTVQAPEAEPQAAIAAQSTSFLANLKRLFSSRQQVTAPPEATGAAAQLQLQLWLDETITFLEAHRDHYLLLETIELDTMCESDAAALRDCVEEEIARCLEAGAAVDALSSDIAEAGRQLKMATTQRFEAAFDAFSGLRLDDDCDGLLSGAMKHPLGLR
jgi:hypothetical protein